MNVISENQWSQSVIGFGRKLLIWKSGKNAHNNQQRNPFPATQQPTRAAWPRQTMAPGIFSNSYQEHIYFLNHTVRLEY